MDMSFEVKGLAELTALLVSAGGDEFLQKYLAPAVYTQANAIMTESKRQVPVQYGTLRGSGQVDQPVVKDGNVTVTLGYNTPYAVYVHENLAAHHNVGNAKYLENPMVAAVPAFADMVAARVRAALEKRAS